MGRCRCHQFDPQTHRCTRCNRWESGYAPQPPPVRPRAVCQVCEREQAVHEGRMMHHGYHRPGWGTIEDDCFGVGHPPFPATDALILWRGAVQHRLESLRATLDWLPHASALRYSRRQYYPRATPDVQFAIRRGAAAHQALGLPAFADHLQTVIRQTQAEIAQVERELLRISARMEKANAIVEVT